MEQNKQVYDHLMIDIETLGTKSNSVILSIAAVNFNLDTGSSLVAFRENISLQSSLDMGLKFDAETLRWWLSNNPKVLKDITDNASHLSVVLQNFEKWISGLNVENLKVWGNSARFDLGLIENAFNAIPIAVPWKHYNERDVRTLVAFAPEIKEETKFVGNKHEPLDDCLHQINYCAKIWQTLKRPVYENRY